MSTDLATRARDNVDRERLASTLMELIDIPSPTGGELALAEALFERFESMGLRASLQEVEPGECNVVGTLEGSGDGPTTLFVGHLDTTWSGDEEGIRDHGDAYKPIARRDGDWIYGMGAYNMKCGIATSVEAIQAVVDSGAELRGDVVVAGVVGESPKAQVGRFQGGAYRGAGKGARHLVNNGVVADICVVPESTSGQISIASGGYVYAELVTPGHPGATYQRHGVEGEQRVLDAIERMDVVLAAVRRWAAEYPQRNDSPDAVPTHVAITSVEGGLPYRPTKQAPFCRATVEIGTGPGESLADVVAELRALVRETGVEGARVNVLQAVPGAAVDPAEPVVGLLSAAHEREFGEPAGLTRDGWLADTSHLTRYGIPSVCYSTAGRQRAGGTGYYAVDGEQCYLPDLERGARVFADLMVDVGARSRCELGEAPPRPCGTVVL